MEQLMITDNMKIPTYCIFYLTLFGCISGDIPEDHVDSNADKCLIELESNSNFDSEIFSGVEDYLLHSEALKGSDKNAYYTFVERVLDEGPVTSRKQLLESKVISNYYYNIEFSPSAFTKSWQCLSSDSYSKKEVSSFQTLSKRYLRLSLAAIDSAVSLEVVNREFMVALSNLPKRTFDSEAFRYFLLFLLWDRINEPLKSKFFE